MLEPTLFVTYFPKIQAISLAATRIVDEHSDQERIYPETVEPVYLLLLALLQGIPVDS
jgi:hypothetical protein